MTMFWTIFVMALVGVVVLVVFYALFELTPFARHSDSYRDPRTHKRIGTPPNLEDGHY